MGRTIACWMLLSALGLLFPATTEAQQVTLSLARFQELWDAAHPPPAAPPEPVVPLAVEAARVDLVVGQDSATLTTTLRVRVFAPDWQELPLGEFPPLVELRSRSGAELRLRATPAPPRLEIRGPGDHEVVLTHAVPVTTDRSAVEVVRRLQLMLPQAAAVTGSLSLTGDGDGDRDPGAIQLDLPPQLPWQEDGSGRWRFVGVPGSQLAVAWRTISAPAPANDRGPLVFDATSASALTVSRARLRLTAWLGLQVRSGVLETLEIPLPVGYEVLAVTGDAVASWDLTESRLQVMVKEPGTGSSTLEVQLAADPADEFGVPLLAPRGVRHLRTALKVAVSGTDGLLESTTLGAVEALPADQLQPDSAGSAALFPSGFVSAAGGAERPVAGAAEARWRVTWATGGDVLTGQVDRLVIDVLVGETGAVLYRLWAAVRIGDAGLDVSLPPGARLLAAERNGEVVTPGAAGSGWRLPMLVRETTQVVYLETRFELPFPTAGGRWSLPLPALSVPVSQVEVRALLPPGFRYRLAEPTRSGRVDPPPTPAGAPGSQFERWPSPRMLFPAPQGFAVAEARWVGFTPTPPPLLIDIEPLPATKEAP